MSNYGKGKERKEENKKYYEKSEENPQYRNDVTVVCADVVSGNVCVVYVE